MLNSKNHISFSPYITYQDDDAVLKNEAEKLKANANKSLLETSNANETTFELYSKLNKPAQEVTSTNLYKKYTEISREINWNDPPELVLPNKTFNIDNYQYTPPSYVGDVKYNVKNTENTSLMYSTYNYKP